MWLMPASTASSSAVADLSSSGSDTREVWISRAPESGGMNGKSCVLPICSGCAAGGGKTIGTGCAIDSASDATAARTFMSSMLAARVSAMRCRSTQYAQITNNHDRCPAPAIAAALGGGGP